MSEYIRVKQKETGHELTIRSSQFNPDGATRLDKPATAPGGEPLPPKYKTTVATAAGSKSGQKADPKNEES